ncbi:MAG: hypothetical protein JNL97_03090, partial [Verrucomicrobiales bacterium]|nr:hypothetical protein [Verrucomicrobiales bacterium]
MAGYLGLLRVPGPKESLHRARAPAWALIGMLLSWACGLPARPAEPSFHSRLPLDYSVRRWTGKGGLPLRSVEAILQTRDGFIWFGMNGGLGRFDGASFQVYDPANTPALPVSYITALAEDLDGSLWIGSAGGGLTHFVRGYFRNFGETNGLDNAQVKSLYVARDGLLWIGTDGGGAFSREPRSGAFRRYGPDEGLVEPFVFGITEDRNGELLVATHNMGPFRRRGGRFERVPMVPPASGASGFALTRSPNGRVWLGTASGVYRLEDSEFRLWPPSRDIPGHDAVVAWEVEDDHVWLGTAQGLVQWRAGAFTNYAIGGGSSGRFASAFLRDQEGSLWTSVEGAGVIQLRRSKFGTLGAEDGLADDVVTSVTSTRNGDVWIGTPKGLHRFADGVLETFGKEDGLTDTFVFSLAEDSTGTLWVSTRLGGLCLLEGRRFVPLPKSEQPPNRGPWCITPVRDGSVWIGTRNGAIRYRDRRRVEHLNGSDVLSNDDVRSIAEDGDGGLWFGTSYGLNHRANGRTTAFTKLTNLPPLEVTVALHPDPDGSLWIGTMTRGLFLHRAGRFHHFGPAQGFHADGILSITPEGSKALWIGTSRG